MKRLLLLTALCVSTAGTLAAQSTESTVIDRAAQPGLPPTQPPDSPATESDIAKQTDSSDAGVQRMAEPRKLPFKVSVSTDIQVYYTDNVLLADSGTAASNSDAVVFGGTLAVRLTGNPIALDKGVLTPSIAFVYQNFRHGIGSDDAARDGLDFDAYSIPMTVSYRFGEGWEASAGLTASAVYRIHGAGDYSRIIASYTPSLSISKVIPISKEQVTVLSSSLSKSFSKANVPALATYRDDRNDKYEFSLDATHYILKGKWTFSPYARVSYSYYEHFEELANTPDDRTDLTASTGFVASYRINSRSSARVYTNYEVRDSQTNTVDYDYKAGTIGLGASLSWTF